MSVTNLYKMHGPRLTADWNKGKSWFAWHHARWSTCEV